MPNISNYEYNKLLNDQKRLKKMLDDEMLKPFIEAFTSGLGTVFAYKPMSQWPSEAKDAFNAARRRYPELGRFYKEEHILINGK